MQFITTFVEFNLSQKITMNKSTNITVHFTPTNILKYNEQCLHYNITANACYMKLTELGTPLHKDYLHYITAALIVFDMGRQMGQGLDKKYLISEEGFGSRLHTVIDKNKEHIKFLENIKITEFNIQDCKHKEAIKKLYNSLALDTDNFRLSEADKDFHVGATKILHFINPRLFPIIDSNVANFARKNNLVSYKNSTQPGYSDANFIELMQQVKLAILKFGEVNFQSLEQETPIMRVFDKIAFSA